MLVTLPNDNGNKYDYEKTIERSRDVSNIRVHLHIKMNKLCESVIYLFA
jgi:hypothetical protein